MDMKELDMKELNQEEMPQISGAGYECINNKGQLTRIFALNRLIVL